jgi:hypothetical protein
MNLHHLLWLLCVISFALGAGNVPAGVNWLCLGLAFAAATQLM